LIQQNYFSDLYPAKILDFSAKQFLFMYIEPKIISDDKFTNF